MTDRWRAFIGEPGERTRLDASGVPWAEARRLLLEWLADDYPSDVHEVCGHCAAAAKAATEGLNALPSETPGQWDVDWDTYALWRTPS